MKINFEDKQVLNTNPEIPDNQKIKNTDINQIKKVVNLDNELLGNIDNTWDYSKTYLKGSYVTYDGLLYQNITGINGMSGPDTDSINWQQTSLVEVLNNMQFNKGNLIAVGAVVNTSSNNTSVAKDASLAFSSTTIPNKDYNLINYVEGILEGEAGTIKIHTKGVVGLIKVNVTFSGQGGASCVGFWWQGNSNELPDGVEIVEKKSTNYSTALTTGPAGANYGGSTKEFQYLVNTDEDVEFYINPVASVYGGVFIPCSSGTRCVLQVEVYSKNNF